MNRKRNRLNLYWFSAFILFSIISTSVGYGLWSGHLDINGVINTGSLDVDFVNVCSTSICCGCSSDLNYMWSSNMVDINLSYTSHFCKLLTVVKIKNTGSLPATLEKIYVDGINNETHVYVIFLNDAENICEEAASYPIELSNGWNIITPNKIRLGKGGEIYMAMLIVFSHGCCCPCNCDDISNLEMHFRLPWKANGICLGSWSSNLDIYVDAEYN